MRGSRKFCQLESNTDNVFFLFLFFIYFFFFDGMERGSNFTKSGPSSARQRNAIKMAFRWRADNGPPLNAGLVALCFLGDPDQYCYEKVCDFSGGGVYPPMDRHMLCQSCITVTQYLPDPLGVVCLALSDPEEQFRQLNRKLVRYY